MGKYLKRRTLHIWIACLAILLNALAPSISHALAVTGVTSSMLEVCSVDGKKYVSLDQATPEKSPVDSSLHHLQHCPFCMSHAGSFALPTSLNASFAVVGGHDLFPALYYHSPSPLFSWSRAHPRAPPALS
ncbi:hypothetical protein AAKU55_001038 [Oxalobacteraceae bacterium GrIS 1.11]